MQQSNLFVCQKPLELKCVPLFAQIQCQVEHKLYHNH